MLVEQGEAAVGLCPDGTDGWAWWVRLDQEAPPEAFEEHGIEAGDPDREILGTCYVWPDGRIEW